MIARGQVGTTVAMASEDPKLQEAIAFLQKTNLNGESVYEQDECYDLAWPGQEVVGADMII